jgi:hypothetical protein
MVIHRSKFKKTLGHIARGRVSSSEENLFSVDRNITKFDEKTGIEKQVTITYIFRNEKKNHYQKPSVNANVLMRYHDLKSKKGKYEDSKKNLPFEVLTLRGELVYREEI